MSEKRALLPSALGRKSDDNSDPPRATPRLFIRLFGDLTLAIEGREITLQNRKAKALIGYLALTPRWHESRERLIGMLWSESDQTRARASLRQVVHTLRNWLEEEGFDGFAKNRNDVAFEMGSIETDVGAVLSSAERGDPHDLLIELSRITETLLEGFDDVDPSFATWLQVQRENLRQQLIRRLEAHLAKAGPALPGSKRVAEALAQIDPTHEKACQEVMQCCADQGDAPGALAAYNRLWKVLDEDYDMEPSEATQQVVASIKAGTYKPRQIAGDAPKPARVSTLVSPAAGSSPPASTRTHPALTLVMGRFDSLPDQSNLAADLRYDLISTLVRFREWLLIDSELNGRSHTAILHPYYVLTGRVLRKAEGTSLVLSVQESETRMIVWSDRFDLGNESFGEAQPGIVHRIAATLNVHISVDRLRRLASMPDVSLEIYDRWLRGQTLMQSYEPEKRTRAGQIFEMIIADEPNFAPAYSGLVQLENSHHIVYAGTYRTPERRQRATAMARKAVSLDPLDSRAQLCLAWAKCMSDKHELAEIYFRLAYELNIDDPWTTTSTALGFAFCNRLDDARALADQALQRVPAPSPIHWSYQTQIRFLCGDLAGAVKAGELAGDGILYLPGWLAAAYHAMGDTAKTVSECERFVKNVRARWYGETAATDEAIGRWFVHCFPIRDRSTWERLRSGLDAAGIPAPGSHMSG